VIEYDDSSLGYPAY